MIKYIEWDKQKLEEYLKDKLRDRGIDICEYEFIIKFLRVLKPRVIVDVGTFLGVSGYILGTSSPSLEYLYAIENIDDSSYSQCISNGKLIPKTEYGKYLPKCAVFKTHGYHNDLEPILKEHPDAFVFFDAVKLADRVLQEIELCHKNKIEYIGLHDTGKHYRAPRRAIKRAEQLGWYEIIKEEIECAKNGISILKLITS